MGRLQILYESVLQSRVSPTWKQQHFVSGSTKFYCLTSALSEKDLHWNCSQVASWIRFQSPDQLKACFFFDGHKCWIRGEISAKDDWSWISASRTSSNPWCKLWHFLPNLAAEWAKTVIFFFFPQWKHIPWQWAFQWGGKAHICCVWRARGLASWCQKNGYLALTEEKFAGTKVSNPNLEKCALSVIKSL